jgi:hypothetical protein
MASDPPKVLISYNRGYQGLAMDYRLMELIQYYLRCHA